MEEQCVSKKKYYYYKKKVGRHKKPGPKKKKKMRGRRWQERWDYKIVICNNRKQDSYVNRYHDLPEVTEARKQLEERNSKILFPKLNLNNGHKSKDIETYRSEYVILKRIREGNTETTQLRNEYGKLVTIETNSDIWIVYDRFPHLVEETFWVYGYNPKNDRKDCKWIMEHIIEDYVYDVYSILQIFLYNNKMIFKYDNNDFDFVICKNVSDAIRLYNLFKNKYLKQKNILFKGMVTKKSEKTQEVFKMLKDKTGWEDTKIYRKSTRA